MTSMRDISLTVNGTEYQGRVEARVSLADFLVTPMLNTSDLTANLELTIGTMLDDIAVLNVTPRYQLTVPLRIEDTALQLAGEVAIREDAVAAEPIDLAVEAVEDDEERDVPQRLEDLEERLERIEALLRRLVESDGS